MIVFEEFKNVIFSFQAQNELNQINYLRYKESNKSSAIPDKICQFEISKENGMNNR